MWIRVAKAHGLEDSCCSSSPVSSAVAPRLEPCPPTALLARELGQGVAKLSLHEGSLLGVPPCLPNHTDQRLNAEPLRSSRRPSASGAPRRPGPALRRSPTPRPRSTPRAWRAAARARPSRRRVARSQRAPGPSHRDKWAPVATRAAPRSGARGLRAKRTGIDSISGANRPLSRNALMKLPSKSFARSLGAIPPPT